jgi:hypothetical protein
MIEFFLKKDGSKASISFAQDLSFMNFSQREKLSSNYLEIAGN